MLGLVATLGLAASALAGPVLKPVAAPLQQPRLDPGKLTPAKGVVIRSKLRGFADLHTHPMSHLGFGRKAMHGAPDAQILLPASSTLGCGAREQRAKDMAAALGNCNATHGGWGTDNTCGDHLRAAIINDALDGNFWHVVGHERNLHNDHPHAGYPNLDYWPHHSSILHQQMWWEWIKRAHQGGLRVMVALTVNSETLAGVLNGDRPYDDKTVADVQIAETIRMVDQHRDFMEIAYSSADAERIVRENRLAVILGMEIDKIGNFGKPGVTTDDATVIAEIRRLHTKGIRYAFPIHLIDNAFGGTAVYKMLMNMANRHQNGSLFSVMQSRDPKVTYKANFVSDKPGEDALASMGFYTMLEVFQFMPAPCGEFWKGCAPFTAGCCGNYQNIKRMLSPTFTWEAYKRVPPGHVNAKGLTRLGEVAIKEMMRLGMIVDVDHMSELALRRTLEIAEGVRGGYPLVMGHNGVREAGGNERAAPADVVRRIAKLGGMMGSGTAEVNPTDFIANYKATLTALRAGASESGSVTGLGLGTDANGFEPLPHRGPGHRPESADKLVGVPGDAWNHPPARLSCEGSKKISVRSARIGCLDIQRAPNITAYVSLTCGGRTSCDYKAPSQAEYQKRGVQAATRDHCTQAMEIVYRCAETPLPAENSRNFYASFFRESGITSKQKKPNGREWDYFQEGGVPHYGLLPEFLHEVKQNDADVFEHVMSSADAFVSMWTKVDDVKSAVTAGPAEGTFSYTFDPIRNLCPHELSSGDAEFGGHGPRVSGDVTLAIDPTGNRLQATITFSARETTADWSEVRGTWTENVGERAPAGFKYTAIVGASAGRFDQVLMGGGRNEVTEDCDGGEHEVTVMAGARPFARMVVVGDTGGGDISGDANCNCDTRINTLDIAPVQLTLRRR